MPTASAASGNGGPIPLLCQALVMQLQRAGALAPAETALPQEPWRCSAAAFLASAVIVPSTILMQKDSLQAGGPWAVRLGGVGALDCVLDLAPAHGLRGSHLAAGRLQTGATVRSLQPGAPAAILG